MTRSYRLAVALAIAGVLISNAGTPSSAYAGTPTHQTVANLTDTSASILWDSTASETGSVSYGTACNALIGSTTVSGQNHLIDLSNLAPATTYFYTITSGGVVANNGGACYSFKTLPTTLPPTPISVVGRVGSGTGCTTAVTAGLVTVSESRSGAVSGTNATVPNDAGSGVPGTYAVAFNPAAKADSSGYYASVSGDTVTVTADIGGTIASVTAPWNGSSLVVTMPDICMPVATVARVSSFSALQRGRQVEFRWRMGSSVGVSGFSLYAGSVRLNRQLIRTHDRPVYRYRTVRTGNGTYSLHVLLKSGTQVVIAAG